MPINNSRINIAQQMDFIRQHGEYVSYFRGMKCTCSIPKAGTNYADPNRGDPSCAACHGLGWIWIPAGQILGLVSNIKQEKELLQAGIASPGDLVFSPQIGTVLSDYDKIQLTWPEGMPFEGELITRSAEAIDNSYYGIMSMPVEGCIVVDPTTGGITNYTSGIDFVFDENTITWLDGHGPAPGTVYSIKYQALIDWIVFAPPQPRRERGTDLGQLVILRKKHAVFNGA